VTDEHVHLVLHNRQVDSLHPRRRLEAQSRRYNARSRTAFLPHLEPVVEDDGTEGGDDPDECAEDRPLRR
jgi:hypothetical protein